MLLDLKFAGGVFIIWNLGSAIFGIYRSKGPSDYFMLKNKTILCKFKLKDLHRCQTKFAMFK